jgi:leucyl/phenylalanyl-tRNA--protein transferase
MIPILAPGAPFPPVGRALDDPDGLLAAGGDLSVETLVDAYSRGIFPWFGEGDPVLWWSPNPRTVLVPAEMHLSRSLRRRIDGGRFRVSLDEQFHMVMDECAAPRREGPGTWLIPRMKAAYLRLHEAGLAHSVEVWMDGQLAGGVYGVSIGRMFCGESMFSRRTDGSKIALACLAAQMCRWGLPLLDCQLATPHLESLGARSLPRSQFVRLIARLVAEPGPQRWQFDEDLDPVAVIDAAAQEIHR